MLDFLMLREVLMISIISYFVGSIPTGYLVGKIAKKIDIRDYGSGNVGATNVLRTLGKPLGVLTLVVDILKGSFAVYIAHQLFSKGQEYAGWVYLFAGVFAFLGHIFSVWLKFKGGKGVAVAAGVFLFLTPGEWSIALCFFIVIVAISRFVSLGSIVSISLFPILIWLNLFDSPWSLYKVYFFASIFIAVGVILSHRSNIKRIISGTEDKIFAGKSDNLL